MGDFYPCHQFVGEEEYLMGNVNEGITRPDIQKDFGCCNVYTKPACKDCFARFYCSGGCAANGYHAHKDIRSNYEIRMRAPEEACGVRHHDKSCTGRRLIAHSASCEDLLSVPAFAKNKKKDRTMKNQRYLSPDPDCHRYRILLLYGCCRYWSYRNRCHEEYQDRT